MSAPSPPLLAQPKPNQTPNQPNNTSFNFLPLHPHNTSHLAIGDLASWPGIKRCGAAIAMGTRAAENVFAHVLAERHGKPVELREWPEYPAMIGLAVGRKAVVYDPQGGTKCSEEMMKVYFGEDLGFQRELCFSLGFSFRFGGGAGDVEVLC